MHAVNQYQGTTHTTGSVVVPIDELQQQNDSKKMIQNSNTVLFRGLIGTSTYMVVLVAV
jgi:hypothetical protein